MIDIPSFSYAKWVFKMISRLQFWLYNYLFTNPWWLVICCRELNSSDSAQESPSWWRPPEMPQRTISAMGPPRYIGWFINHYNWRWIPLDWHRLTSMSKSRNYHCLTSSPDSCVSHVLFPWLKPPAARFPGWFCFKYSSTIAMWAVFKIPLSFHEILVSFWSDSPFLGYYNP